MIMKTDLTKDLTASIKHELLPQIKEEVKIQLKPIVEKQEKLESSHEVLQSNLQSLTDTVSAMKESISDNNMATPETGVQDVINNSRRRIVIGPITREFCTNYPKEEDGLENLDFIRASLAYLQTNMKIPLEAMNKLRIVSASPLLPRSGIMEEFDMMSIEFATVKMCEDLKPFARNLPPECRLNIHISPVFREQFRALSEMAYNLRHGEPKHKTTIKYTSSGLVLQKRQSNVDRWCQVETNHLPGPDIALLGSPSHLPKKRRRPSHTGLTPPSEAAKVLRLTQQDNNETEEKSNLVQPKIQQYLFSHNKSGPAHTPSNESEHLNTPNKIQLDKGDITDVQFSTPGKAASKDPPSKGNQEHSKSRKKSAPTKIPGAMFSGNSKMTTAQ